MKRDYINKMKQWKIEIKVSLHNIYSNNNTAMSFFLICWSLSLFSYGFISIYQFRPTNTKLFYFLCLKLKWHSLFFFFTQQIKANRQILQKEKETSSIRDKKRRGKCGLIFRSTVKEWKYYSNYEFRFSKTIN